MTILDILRAKKYKEGNYLLKDHIKENLIRVKQLKEFFENNKSSINYHQLEQKDFFDNLSIALLLHDLGKIYFHFQEKVFKYEERKENTKEWQQIKDFFKNFIKCKKSTNIKLRHEILSIIWSVILLENNEWDKKIRTAILLHHYNKYYLEEKNLANIIQDYKDEIQNYIEFLLSKKDEIKDLLENLIDNIVRETNIEILNTLKSRINFQKLIKLNDSIKKFEDDISQLGEFYEIDNENPDYDFFVFLGFLRRCDYSASGDVDVEYTKILKEHVYKELNKKISDKIQKKELWQEKVLKKFDSNNLILVAPTGSGKTEFALLWARNRGKKLIYTLPLRVALNDLYWRFSSNEVGYFDNDFVRILHSTSFIEYLKEEKYGKEVDINEKQMTAKLFSSPIILTTPDQVLLSSLKYYAFDKLVSIYPISAIIIDEIQAYNPEMAAVIIKTIEIIKKLNGNILIITATFPPYFEEFLNPEKGFTIVDLDKNDIKNQIKNYNLKRHKIEIIRSPMFTYKADENKNSKLEIQKECLKKIEEEINKDKNILIVVNNVSKAIYLYKEIEKICGNLGVDKENLYLLHSRLLEKEKDRRINDPNIGIKEKLKKNKKRIILVATQIIEASVDLDFDILLTEISPIDSQIQRWGRVYRNRDKDYDNENEANIYIFSRADEGTLAIYDKRVIEKTVEVLENLDNKEILDYEKERDIIKEVFDSKIENQKLKDIFVNEINKNLKWLNYYYTEKISEARIIFRRIAGIQVVLPQVMEKENDKLIKCIAKIIDNIENKNLSWKEIIEKIKNKLNIEINEWKVKEILYNYSVNIPIFYFEKIRHDINFYEFKGFFVLKNLKSDKEIEEVNKYGIDCLCQYHDIDSKEIEEYSNII